LGKSYRRGNAYFECRYFVHIKKCSKNGHVQILSAHKKMALCCSPIYCTARWSIGNKCGKCRARAVTLSPHNIQAQHTLAPTLGWVDFDFILHFKQKLPGDLLHPLQKKDKKLNFSGSTGIFIKGHDYVGHLELHGVLVDG
jgi:hypothetical protein